MYTNIRWQQRFQNFQKAFTSLTESNEALLAEPNNSFIKDSLIQRYEYSIELAWKTLKDFLEHEGYTEAVSPKAVLRLALKEGYLKNPEWLNALEDRNKTSHAYDEQMAKEVIAEIQTVYFGLLADLNQTLQKLIDHTNE
jgi:nucleotidyltransferase substrate binding protein (TIGR01987 family)